MSISLKILYFGPAREAAGLGSEEITLEDSVTVKELKELLLERHSSLRQTLTSSRVAVEEEYVAESFLIDRSVDVALIPPVAGG